MWLPDGASLYDRLGNGLSLLRLRDDANVVPFVESAAAHGVPLSVIELRGQTLEELYSASLLLVRPDQHVTWRGESVDRAMAEAIIDRVRGV
ncbi:MAG: aromatic-ring hydroxylase C-terminal domain-containing protein [Ktedonobacteraceae bacterium]